MPIKTFKCRDTQRLFEGTRVPRFVNIERIAIRKLAMLHRVLAVDEMRIPPNNRLEALRGDRKGFWSVRINDQWRLCFRFVNSEALDVEITDYH